MWESEEIRQASKANADVHRYAVLLYFVSVTRQLCNGHVNTSFSFSAFPLLDAGV